MNISPYQLFAIAGVDTEVRVALNHVLGDAFNDTSITLNRGHIEEVIRRLEKEQAKHLDRAQKAKPDAVDVFGQSLRKAAIDQYDHLTNTIYRFDRVVRKMRKYSIIDWELRPEDEDEVMPQ